jgi:hypothetical protein
MKNHLISFGAFHSAISVGYNGFIIFNFLVNGIGSFNLVRFFGYFHYLLLVHSVIELGGGHFVEK